MQSKSRTECGPSARLSRRSAGAGREGLKMWLEEIGGGDNGLRREISSGGVKKVSELVVHAGAAAMSSNQRPLFSDRA